MGQKHVLEVKVEGRKCNAGERQFLTVELCANVLMGFERSLPLAGLGSARCGSVCSPVRENSIRDVRHRDFHARQLLQEGLHAEDAAAAAVILAALSAAEKLLESFPGMQEAVMAPIGSLACCAGDTTEQVCLTCRLAGKQWRGIPAADLHGQ